MKILYSYYKNSNTNEYVKKLEVVESHFHGFPDYFYDLNGSLLGEDLTLVGFVPISKRKWDRMFVKTKKS